MPAKQKPNLGTLIRLFAIHREDCLQALVQATKARRDEVLAVADATLIQGLRKLGLKDAVDLTNHGMDPVG